MSDGHQHLASAGVVEQLRATPLFGGLGDEQLERLVEMGEIVDLPAGARLIGEGDIADALYVVLAGELEVTRRAGTSQIPVARVGPGSLQGEIAALEGGRRLASVHAATDAEVLRIPIGAVRELLSAGPDVSLAIIRTAVSRLREMEATLREREQLAALGTLAAGLAHELNNPAAAAVRAVRHLADAIAASERLPRPESTPDAPEGVGRALAPLEHADRIEELAALIGDPDDAGPLVDAGWTAGALRDLPPDTIRWLAASAATHQLIDEVGLAVGRISEIVGAVKGYVYLDQRPVQRVDVRTGLEQTLIILRHRLAQGIEVRRELADDLPEIEAHGSELNQVWTNLIDNAIDAMDGRGTLTVRADADPGADGVRVSVCDTGGGVPDDVRPHLFEPFYTTKEPGKGTGLGLHISHTVVARHAGRIEVESEPGRTCFVVSLPAGA